MSVRGWRGAGSREHRSSIVVTALSAAFGVGLVQATSFLATMVSAGQISRHGSAQFALLLVASAFIVVAVYVAAIVTANTFATIVAGRTRTIALLLLVGASAASLRVAVARDGLVVGALGSVVGAAVGLGLAFGGLWIGVAMGAVPGYSYGTVSPLVVFPAACVVLSTWAASWVGSRGVLSVTPVQAAGSAVEQGYRDVARRPVRAAASAILFLGGAVLLVGGVALGLVSMLGFPIAFLGGILSFTGVIVGAHRVMPFVLRATGRLAGSTPSARLAAANAVRYPERSTRTTVGLVIGVTLVTTFAVAAQGYAAMLKHAQEMRPESFQGSDTILAVTVGVFSVLIGFSAVIAAFGMINNLSLSVIQRTRELGLLRALGFTARQVRGMIVAESAQLTFAAVGLGLLLGIGYGWAGAQSLLGAVAGSPELMWPPLPWMLFAGLAFGAGVLTVAASLVPARRATTVTPVTALAVE